MNIDNKTHKESLIQCLENNKTVVIGEITRFSIDITNDFKNKLLKGPIECMSWSPENNSITFYINKEWYTFTNGGVDHGVTRS